MSKQIVLVVPSIREDSWNRFVKEWDAVGLFGRVDVVLMEDNPRKTFKTHRDFTHLCWEDIDSDPKLRQNSWIIPRRSDTVRSYAYYRAWQTGCQFVLTLDDDCYPPTQEKDGFTYKEGAEGFLKAHVEALTSGSRWFNTLTSVKPRGIPFYNKGTDSRVIVNHGLWTNVLDYDAPTQLVDPIKEKFAFDSRIVPSGQYFPMCGMNVMWKREATVLMYHLLMGSWFPRSDPHGFDDSGSPIPVKLPFDRFGDIWCGIFMKKIADSTGHRVKTGLPYIHHDRASNPFTNLRKEANGLEVNEKMWEVVDGIVLEASRFPGSKFNDYYYCLGKELSETKTFGEHNGYFNDLGNAMMLWSDLFR